jgi:Tfp pilus assembly protein PilO
MSKKLDTQMIAVIALVAVGLLIGAAGYFTLVSSEQSKAAKVASQISDAQTQLVVAEGASAKPVPFHASDLFRFANAMPGSTDMPGILLGLRHLAQRSKVQLTSVRPSSPTALALGYSALPLAITVTGNYLHITKFLALVRTNVRLVGGTKLQVGGRMFDTDNISLSQGTVGDQLNATLTLVAFSYTGQVLPAPGSTTTTDGSTTTGSTTTTATTTTSGT